MSIPNADNILFNLSLYNNNTVSIPAEIYLNRDQPFINNVEDYYIRLVSAEISTAEVPLFDYKGDMFVELNSIRVQVQFETLFTDDTKSVVFLTQFLNGVNLALNTAHVTAGAPGRAPIFIYDNQEVKMVVDQLYVVGVDYFAMNEILIAKFPSFMTKYNPSTTMYVLQYGNYGNNLYNTYPGGISYPVYVIGANVTQYATIPEYTSMVVTSSSIPVNKQQVTSLGSTTRTLGVLDIIPLYFDDVTKFTIKFYEQTVPQYNDLLSKGVLSEIDFKIYLVDVNYNLVPLFIPPKTSVICRIEFTNKQIVKNHYPQSENRSRIF